MGSEWKEKYLVDCLDKLIDYRGKTPKKAENGILTLSAKSVKNGTIDYSKAYYISRETYNKFMTRGFPKKGDILMTTEAPLGYVAKLDRDDVAIAQRLLVLRGNSSKLDNSYLLYYLKSVRGQHELLSRATGTTVQGIKRSEFEKVRIVLPSISEQKAIAHILGTLDEKIELNRRMNATLEQMAQAMFKSWFVDFDPVIDKALAAGNPIPEPLQKRAEKRKALGDKRKPLPEDIQKLFPDEFEFSEELDKWVPKGWEVKPIDKMIQINPRVTLKKETIAPFVDMKALPTSGYSVSDVITKEYKGGAKFEKDDVLLARITPCLENGKAGIVDFLHDGEVGFGSTEFIVLRGKEAIKTAFIACLIRDSKFRKHAIQSMVGSSGRQRVQNACFSSYYLAIPDNVVLNNFDRLISSNFKTITQNKEEIITSTILRDTLLPKLISGEKRIKIFEDSQNN
ncbi:MAG TPA: restriction endonuclease subunit S [Marinilabiliaceae bacterium]|nr:restriction endonuclease subunit S [Marinilabiliaceae bacterium]